MSTQKEGANMSNLVWQSQPLDAPRISLEYVRHQAEKLNSDVRRENYLIRIVAIVCAVLLVLLVILKPSDPPPIAFTRVSLGGAFLLLFGVIYTAFEVRRRGRVLAIGKEEGVVRGLEAYSIELRRRRDYCLDWQWSIWPIAPAVVVMLVGGILYDQRPNKVIRYGLVSVGCVVGTLLGALRVRRKGRKYQRELDALATLDKS